MNVGFLTQEKWWYWGPFNTEPGVPKQTTPGPAIRVNSGFMTFRADFMVWSDFFYDGGKVDTPYQMSSVPDLTPAAVSGPGYGWGEFVLPGSGTAIHLAMAAAHFQALAFAFYGNADLSESVKVSWTLSNDVNGADLIMAQNNSNGMVPTDPVDSGVGVGKRAKLGPEVVNARLWRAQPVAHEVHIRMWVSDGGVSVPVFVMGLLGQLSS